MNMKSYIWKQLKLKRELSDDLMKMIVSCMIMESHDLIRKPLNLKYHENNLILKRSLQLAQDLSFNCRIMAASKDSTVLTLFFAKEIKSILLSIFMNESLNKNKSLNGNILLIDDYIRSTSHLENLVLENPNVCGVVCIINHTRFKFIPRTFIPIRSVFDIQYLKSSL